MIRSRTKLTGIFLGLLGTLAAGLGFYEGVYERVERLSLDLRFRYFNPSIRDSRQICVVAVDDGSLAGIGDWPWPRTHFAKIINLLNELESRQILTDLVFSMPKTGADAAGQAAEGGELSEDEALARACREQGQVTLATYFIDAPAKSAVYDLLLGNLNLRADEAAEKTGQSLSAVRANFVSLRRLAARQKVGQWLAREPKLTKAQVLTGILRDEALHESDARREVERAYDYHRAYDEIRSRLGWRVEGGALRRPITPIPETRQMVVPVAPLAASCADVGFVDFVPDSDGKVREIGLLASYEDKIYRQLGLAGACQYLQIEPGKFLIGSRGIDLRGGRTAGPADKGQVLLTGPEPSGIHIPVTRTGKMIVNWYIPPSRQWEQSFTVIPAARLLEIAINQDALRRNRQLLTEAMDLTIRNFLPKEHEQYVKLIKRLPMLKESVENVPVDLGSTTTTAPADELEPPETTQPSETDGATAATEPATQPTTASAPARTLEQDLAADYRQTQARVAQIESEAREQLDWLYQQLDQLPPGEQSREDNRLVRDLWRCLNRPQEIRRINADLETGIHHKVNDLFPLIRGKIVLIGSTATTLADFVPTPVYDHCPGVIVHANVLNQILEKSFFTESDRNGDLLVILVIGTLVSIISAQRSAFEGLLWMLILLVGFSYFTCAVVFGRLHVVSSLVGPALAVVLSWMLVNFYRHLTEGRAKRIFAGRLSQYTSPALARRIAEQPEMLEILPEQREVTCYFSDIASFTPLSERLGPERTVEFLNLYLEHMSEVLDDQEAFINKFQGDGIFAFFNPPLHNQPDHARRACLAAVESQIALPHLHEVHLIERFAEFEEPLKMRVGISTGKAVVGDCGSARKFDYTCLGDTVNLASRLEGANKFFGTSIMICDRTFREMGEDLLARLLGKIRVVGRQQPVMVYELIGYRKNHADRIEHAELFEKMVLSYWLGEFDGARSMLTTLEKMRPDDKAVKVYRDQLDKIARTGRAQFRDGVIEIEMK